MNRKNRWENMNRKNHISVRSIDFGMGSNRGRYPIVSLWILLVILSMGFGACTKKNSDHPELLVGLLLGNSVDANLVSILEIEMRDMTSYEGRCLDRFQGIQAGAYFELHFPPELRNQAHKKVVTSDKACNQLGFSGGVVNAILDGVSFRSSTCSPATSLCTANAIRKAGFH